MQAYIKTYGCSLNHADSKIISTILDEEGIDICDNADDADVLVVNTCTVKSSAERRIMDYIKKKSSEGKRIVATGCMAGSYPERISRYVPEASITTAPNIKRIGHVIRESYAGRVVRTTEYSRFDRAFLLTAKSFGNVVEQIPVSDGCLSSCGFCATKLSRGPLNSFSERSIVNAVRFAVEKGAKEIQITSQDIGSYGLDKGTNIAELMDSIAEIEGDFKVRIGMLNPEHLHRYIDHFIAAFENDKFYKFVHLPIQSGSDNVLRLMGRGYTAGEAVCYLNEIRRLSGISFMTDLIVGYPGENEEDFRQTLDFVAQTKPDTVNLSKFTSRPGTRASLMCQISDSEIKRRSLIATKVIHDSQRQVNESHIGQTYKCLITEMTDMSFNGRTESYKQVVFNHDTGLSIGEKYDGKIFKASSNVLYGKVV